MNDVRCGMCGEPWEVYALNHDAKDLFDTDDPGVPDDPAEYIKKGKGCACCDWGDGERAEGDGRLSGENQADRVRDLMNNTDEDPLKYI